MKELSIEEKAKRYDEALKVLHKYDGANIMFSQSLKEEMFPELKESEDERIREDLITYLRSVLANKEYGDKFIEDWIAWLENQNKKTEPIEGFASEFERQVSHLIASAINREYEYNKGYIKWTANALLNYAKREIEEQGIERKQLYVRFGDIPLNEKSKIYRGEEEIGYENGVSVYPAFELNGNIVLGLTLPITRTTLYTQQHLLEYDNRPCYLVSGDYIGKGTDGEPLIRNISIIKRLYDYRTKSSEEQGNKDILENAVLDGNEDGLIAETIKYKNEKQGEQKPIKEHDACDFCEDRYGCVNPCPMKLIEEQKPVDKVEPKFKVGDIISDGGSEVKIVSIDKNNYNVTNDEIENDAHIGNWVVYFKDQDNWKLVEQPPADKVDQHSLPVSDNSSLPTFEESIYHPCTEELYEQTPTKWSEDDELHIRELESLVKRVWAIAEHENDKDTIHKMSDLSFFLKTLKPQLKQEWGEEDKSRITTICTYLQDYARLSGCESRTIRINEYCDWLKSLRPQLQWKPSKEQMDMLAKVCSTLHLTSGENEIMESLYEQLEKLREE